ncbi:hypothetical protein F5B20DRAFT_581655 [Whalleya microplaca]|nr:hypothetical protein F5B20DRAFT_581655 [Whalleya microplaca]
MDELQNILNGMMNDTREDPVLALFQDLPLPKDRYYSIDDESTSHQYLAAMLRLLKNAQSKSSTDPDFDYLLEAARVGWARREGGAYFSAQLARLAVDKEVLEIDNSIKGQQLRYYRWLAQGAKDEDSPFSTLHGQPSTANRDIHAWLPQRPGSRLCANCGKGNSTNECANCRVIIDGHKVFATTYCGKECQASHWKDHKLACQSLKTVCRASSVFQELLDCHSTSCYADNVVAISENGGIIISELHDYDALAYQGSHILREFPAHLAPSEGHAFAVAHYGRCADIFTVALSPLQLLIGASCKSMEKVVFYPKNMHRPINIVRYGSHDYNSLRSHEVIRVTLNSEEQVVLDPTAAQFGWREYMAPWSIYEKQRVRKIKTVLPIHIGPRPHRLAEAEAEARQSTGDLTADIKQAQLAIMEAATTVTEWTALKYGGIRGLLKLKEDFEDARAKVVSAANNAINEHDQRLKDSPAGKLYFAPNGQIALTNNQEGYNRLRAIWFSKEVYETHKDDPNKLHALWVQRMENFFRTNSAF